MSREPTSPIEAHLRGLSLFAGCSARQYQRLAQVAQLTTLREGRLVMLERHRGEQFHVIVDGHATVSRGDQDVATLRAGDLLGEIGLLDQVDRTATVTAASTLKLLTFDASDFRDLIEQIPEVATRIRAAAAARREPTEVG